EVYIDGVLVRKARIDDVERAERDAHLLHRAFYLGLAANQDGMSEALILEAEGGAHNGRLFAFGKYNAALRFAGPGLYALQEGGRRVSPADQRSAIGVHVGDGFAGNTGVHRSLRHKGRNEADEARIKRAWNDVFAPEAWPGAVIGSGHFIGHILAGQFGNR